jgi:hypothetical protein
VNAGKTHRTGLSKQFGTGVKSGTYETIDAEKQDFAIIIAYLMHITQAVFPLALSSVQTSPLRTAALSPAHLEVCIIVPRAGISRRSATIHHAA